MVARREDIQEFFCFPDGVIGDVLPGGGFLGKGRGFFKKDHHAEARRPGAFHIAHRVITQVSAFGGFHTDFPRRHPVDFGVGFSDAYFGRQNDRFKVLGHAVAFHPVRDLRFGNGVGDDTQKVTAAVKFDDGLFGVVTGHTAPITITPKPCQLSVQRGDAFGRVIRQQVLGP